ncbi:MAG: hypothetical protein AAB439_01735 [Patescibacteria group bacterium]
MDRLFKPGVSAIAGVIGRIKAEDHTPIFYEIGADDITGVSVFLFTLIGLSLLDNRERSS